MPTTPPAIVRDIYDETQSPCADPTDENYQSLLQYHRVGDDYSTNLVADSIQAYLENTGATKSVFTPQAYNGMLYYSDLSCKEFIVKFELTDTGVITIVPEPIDTERKSISRYSTPLLRGLFRVLNAEYERTSDLFFEFTHARVEYRIGQDASKWYTDNTILIALMVKNNTTGAKRYLGVYDVSIPPDNKRHK